MAASAPFAMTNVAVKMSRTVFASDASLGLGAVVSFELGVDTAEAIWLGSDKRGCYTRLDSENVALLLAAGEEVHWIGGVDAVGPVQQPRKGPLLYFDFVEFFAG